MREDIQARCIMLARHIIETGDTVRQAAGRFGLSKSSVHKDVHERLRLVHPGLYMQVQAVMNFHHQVRHLRGGEATRERWRKIREQG
ncbi:MAG: sporulation transcriptional regulator SpoIIID [Clostridia bacterium]|nr:sporulation transcriptional regulator SpoIIID [Clostridia bacterium]